MQITQGDVILVPSRLGLRVTPGSSHGGGTLPVTANLTLWLKSDAGTSTIIAGAPISTWTDQSTVGTVFSQATGANQPTYQVAIQNGLPVVRFDGTNDFLAATAVVSALNSTDTTLYVVCKRNGTTGETTIFGNTDGSTLGTTLNVSSTTFTGRYGNGTTLSGVPDLLSPGTTAHQWTFFIKNTDPTHPQWLRRDGTAENADAGVYNVQSTTAPTVGCLMGGTKFFNGDICELLVYSVGHTLTDIAAIENYLKTKWGTP